jgi:RimJ/RimL family protein N-acetyltransferase
MNLVEHWTLPNGAPLTLRAVREHDAPGLDALVSGLTPRDRRWRFHGAVNGLSPERLRRMVDARLPGQLALVAIARCGGRDTLIADARLDADSTGLDAEFGLMVAAGWRRLGVATHTLAALRRVAAAAGLRWLHGSVRADNAAMLALMRRCGFRCTPSRGDAGVVSVETRVAFDGVRP